MDKQALAVILSFTLYIFYVLLPMVPAIVIYKIFPDTKVAASGLMGNMSFKTTGAFAAYVITVFLGFFLVQNTHQLIAQISKPVWTLKTTVELLNADGTPYKNNNLLETLVVSVDPKLQRLNGNTVILSLHGNKKNWSTTQLKFEIPRFGYALLGLDEISKNSDIDNYELIINRKKPVRISADDQFTTEYSINSTKALRPDNNGGPELENPAP
ncbi:MAG TPA: hypothetical protein ENJ08_11575 [Gammaproteobacteria bacterium]|nr:hypothetical protein [Gammaproteobacteria bacterium]